MNEFENNSRAVLKDIHDQIDKALNESVMVLEQNIREEAPVQSGELKSGVSESSIPGRQERDVYSDQPYSRRIHFGFKATDSEGRTFHQRPNPFMRRGANQSMGTMTQIFERVLSRPIRSLHKRTAQWIRR